ncbi:EKC/KEOPS complex subunit LAGE3 [Heterocephalus glaber]|uniref:L antigen family member 3 n=1 Tax=Heterocephalus glaber TaxID=10181 RepID=A0AAX6QFV1_HETGA|nr:EKC/KEOPS complex subunit LAGE3 [Heterocephalus glaber]
MLTGCAGTAAAAAGSAHPAAGAPKAPGVGLNPAPKASGPESRTHIFALCVLFPTPLDAGIALGSLAPDAEPHPGVIGKELTASGSTLAVRWTAEDASLLQVSVVSFLEQLSLVVRTMQRFGPPVSH